MTQTVPLSESKSGTISSAGTATVTLGPTRPGESWRITNVAVSCTPASSPPPTAVLFGIGGVRLGGTTRGDGDSNDIVIALPLGQFITVIWAGATPAGVATVSVSGERTIP